MLLEVPCSFNDLSLSVFINAPSTFSPHSYRSSLLRCGGYGHTIHGRVFETSNPDNSPVKCMGTLAMPDTLDLDGNSPLWMICLWLVVPCRFVFKQISKYNRVKNLVWKGGVVITNY